MSGYSRHTTSKGQQLLNINPPQTSQYNPYQVLPNKPHLIQPQAYSGIQNNVHGQRITAQYQTGSVLAQQIKSPYINSSQNSRQIYYQEPVINNRAVQNVYRTSGDQSRNPTLIDSRPYFSSQNKVGHRYTNSRTIVGNEQYQQQVQNQNIFGEQQKKEKKKRKQIDETVCCFPGYWLVILLLGVVIASYFLIILKNKGQTIKVSNQFSPLITDEKSPSLALNDPSSSSRGDKEAQIKDSSNLLPGELETSNKQADSKTSFMFPPLRHHLTLDQLSKNHNK